MNDGRYSTFIDMKKMKENGLICDEKALIHQRQIDGKYSFTFAPGITKAKVG